MTIIEILEVLIILGLGIYTGWMLRYTYEGFFK